MNKRYEEYKPSGVEWLGNVPSHWAVTIISRLCNMGRGRVINHEYIHEHPGIYPIYSSQTADNGVMGLIDTYDFEGEYVTWTTDGANAGTVSHREGKFNCTNVCGTLSAKEQNIYLKFLPYILNLGTKYSVRFDINPKLMNGMMGRIPICVPPIEEQHTIVNFLDEKTAQLDQFITQKQQMLELLREERTALINHAVTKGLDADAPMRDSGIEWLGEVPAHWKVKRLKWIAEIQGGLALSSGKALANSVTMPYLRVANVQDGYLDLSELKTVEVEVDQVSRYSLAKGDLLMNEGGDNDKLGRGCVWNGEVEPCLHQNHVFAVRLLSGYNPEWLNLITTTEGARIHFMTRAKQSTNLASISSSNIKELLVLLPPAAEQQQIIDFVAAESAQIAEVTDTINQEIALLREYRAALIAEAVTGQIDVRDYEPVAQEMFA